MTLHFRFSHVLQVLLHIIFNSISPHSPHYGISTSRTAHLSVQTAWKRKNFAFVSPVTRHEHPAHTQTLKYSSHRSGVVISLLQILLLEERVIRSVHESPGLLESWRALMLCDTLLSTSSVDIWWNVSQIITKELSAHRIRKNEKFFHYQVLFLNQTPKS